ncbi:MAG TPA: 2Fe-2S iron-sulfur cluster binding domain-containing protein [Hyphomicrobiaceae bacterium]|nr:2Fe-2S iron-sulfur cluster binding domain-containing protein [Hyphomicrobiaceae bacterium]
MARLHAVVANDARFSVRSGELLLDAALASGIELPHDCRAGRCGTCLMRLRKGRTFGGESRQQGMIYACQARVFSDLTLEYDVLPPVERVDARVSRIANLTHDVVEMTIAPAKRLRILPGQYCRFTFKGFPTRAFSPTAPLDRPGAGRSFRLNIKRVRDGRVSPNIGRLIKVGHPLKVEGPFGSAFLRPGKAGRLVLVAGGTGFAPMWAVADAALRENYSRPIVLIAGVRNLKSFYMWPALQRVAQLPNVSVIATGEEEDPAYPAVRKGRPNDHLPELTQDDIVYAAGAPRMVDSIAKAAEAARAAFYCDPFEASGQAKERGGWRNVLSWIRAA